VNTHTQTNIGYPVVYLKDLRGCGTIEYAKSAQALDVKARTLCQAPFSAITLSYSGLTHFAAGSISPRLDELMGFIAPLAFSLASADPYGDISKIQALPGATWDFRALEWVQDRMKEGIGTLRVQVPRVEEVYDECGLVVGTKVSATVAHQGFDPVTCLSYLLESTSLKVFVTNKDIFGSLDEASATNVLKQQLPTFPTFSSAPAGGLVATNSSITEDYIAIFKTKQVLNTVYSVGV
jgi:hypothetical protein